MFQDEYVSRVFKLYEAGPFKRSRSSLVHTSTPVCIDHLMCCSKRLIHPAE